jgi:hypothetical protein
MTEIIYYSILFVAAVILFILMREVYQERKLQKNSIRMSIQLGKLVLEVLVKKDDIEQINDLKEAGFAETKDETSC